MGSLVAPQFVQSTLLILVLLATVAWATLCNQAHTLVKGRVLKNDVPSVTYIMLAMVGPGRWIMLAGILLGLLVYFVVLTRIVMRPRLRLLSGDRFYSFRYRLDRLIPLAYIAPEPLSPLFEPAATVYLTPGMFGIPVWRISIFDPPALHAYLSSRGTELSSHDLEWEAVVSRYRRALRVLGLLEALGKLETMNLDRTALAAAARLAIHSLPESARISLLEALPAFAAPRRRTILTAFDLLPFHV